MKLQCYLVILTVLVCSVISLPRDSTALRERYDVDSIQSTENTKNEEPNNSVPTFTRNGDSENTVTSSWPHRVPCQFDEATEDSVCQEHCLPKGYTFGLCVGRTCSCI